MCFTFLRAQVAVAMCSHSCNPNAFWNFDGAAVELRAGAEIAQGPAQGGLQKDDALRNEEYGLGLSRDPHIAICRYVHHKK